MQLSGGNFPRWKLSGGNCPGGICPSGAIVWRETVQGGIVLFPGFSKYFISTYTVLNKLSEHVYISKKKKKKITSYAFSSVFKIVKSLRCILNLMILLQD